MNWHTGLQFVGLAIAGGLGCGALAGTFFCIVEYRYGWIPMAIAWLTVIFLVGALHA